MAAANWGVSTLGSTVYITSYYTMASSNSNTWGNVVQAKWGSDDTVKPVWEEAYRRYERYDALSGYDPAPPKPAEPKFVEFEPQEAGC